MRRLLIVGGALAVLCLLIVLQFSLLGVLANRLTRLRKDYALERLPRPAALPVAKAAPYSPPARSQRLEAEIRKASKSLGGVALLSPEKLFKDYPELETSFLKAKEAQLRLDYAAFFVRAGFSQQQIDRYLEICLQGERDWIALTKEAQARGVDLSDPAIKAIGQGPAAQRKREMAELLGPVGLALREKFSEERPAQYMTLALAKATGGASFSPEQMDRLTALTTELGLFDNDRVSKNPKIFSTVIDRAAGVLSPEQLKLFELMIDAREADLLRFLERRQSR